MAIKEWPSADKPREKLASQGTSSLTDAELLAIFIRTGVPGKNAVDIGKSLVRKYGGLRNILNAEQQDLCSEPGLGPAKFATLQAALELGKRYLDEKFLRDSPLSSPQQVADFLTRKLRDQDREVFALIYLDNRHRVLHYNELFYGTLNGASVYPREVVKNVLRYNAAAVIVAHNHPSGIAEPSPSDTAITQKLKEAFEIEIPDEDAETIVTVENAVNYINKHTN